jgi:hypothetical protein
VFRLPKFYREDQTATYREFYDFFFKDGTPALSAQDFAEEVGELHEENYFFAHEVGVAMSQGLVNTGLLETEYSKYVDESNQARLIK